MYVMNDLYTRIDTLLKERRLTQKDLSEYLGLSSVQRYANWKQRNTMPAADTALKIAQYLGISVEYLLTGTEKDLYKGRFEKLLQDMQSVIDKA